MHEIPKSAAGARPGAHHHPRSPAQRLRELRDVPGLRATLCDAAANRRHRQQAQGEAREGGPSRQLTRSQPLRQDSRDLYRTVRSTCTVRTVLTTTYIGSNGCGLRFPITPRNGGAPVGSRLPARLRSYLYGAATSWVVSAAGASLRSRRRREESR
jgi:hypothetical protein